MCAIMWVTGLFTVLSYTGSCTLRLESIPQIPGDWISFVYLLAFSVGETRNLGWEQGYLKRESHFNKMLRNLPWKYLEIWTLLQHFPLKSSHTLKVYQTIAEVNKNVLIFIHLGDGVTGCLSDRFCDHANCRVDKECQHQ